MQLNKSLQRRRKRQPLSSNVLRTAMKVNHFEREAKIMAWFLPALILLALIGGLLLPWLMEQMAIDRCLDSGGAFNYEIRTCAHEAKSD
jgi:hypothetical protein